MYKSWIAAMGVVVALAATGAPAQAATFSEGFDNIATLSGAGWSLQNLSSPVGTTGWFQGVAATFPAQSGAPTSYIGANFNNAAGTGTISNWLLTPNLTFFNGDTISFFTRTVTEVAFPDRLELRFSGNGASTNVGTTSASVGDFTTLLLTVNPNLTFTGYPSDWTQFTATLSGLAAGGVSGRVGFRYFVPDGGPLGSNSDFIGIDTLNIAPVPEPSAVLGLVMLGGFGLYGRRRMQAKKKQAV